MLITTHHTQREIVLKNIEKVEEASNILCKWFCNNYMVAND